MTEKLKTETNTPKMEMEVLKAFGISAAGFRCQAAQACFEHGQWWVVDPVSGGAWSVVDAAGPGSIGGFDFECVTEPDDDSGELWGDG